MKYKDIQQLRKQADYIDTVDDYLADIDETLDPYGTRSNDLSFHQARYNLLTNLFNSIKAGNSINHAGQLPLQSTEPNTPAKQLFVQYLNDDVDQIHPYDEWREAVARALKNKKRFDADRLISNLSNYYVHTGNDSLRFPSSIQPIGFVSAAYKDTTVPSTIQARLDKWRAWKAQDDALNSQLDAIRTQRRLNAGTLEKKADYIDTLETLPFDVGSPDDPKMSYEEHKYNEAKKIIDKIVTRPVANLGFNRAAVSDVGKMPTGVAIETYGHEIYSYPQWVEAAAKLIAAKRYSKLDEHWPDQYYVKTTGDSLTYEPLIGGEDTTMRELATKLYGKKLPAAIEKTLKTDSRLAAQERAIDDKQLKHWQKQPSFLTD